jgi:YggT family protein
MFILSNFLAALAQVLNYVLWAYSWILLGRVIVSWFNVDDQNPIVHFLYATTEPVLAPVRRRMPVFAVGLDLSPFVVWFAVLFLQRFLVRSLYELAFALR